MLKAVIYCRCSTEEESQKDALKQQSIEARNAVVNNGWNLVHEYIESKSGTSSEKRDEYRKLYEDLQSEEFDIVVIKSQDRLMRNTKDWYLFVDRLVTNGKRLYMYLENKFYTADDSLITGIKAILAEEYSRELSKKINNAHRNRQQKGEIFVLPPNTYGLRRVSKGQYELIEEETNAIKVIFHMAKTCGCGVIANTLEENGMYDRNGKPFEEEAIRRIIRNPIRCGTVIQNKRHYDFEQKKQVKNPKEKWIVHKNVVPASVSEQEWLEANQAMDERAEARNVKEYTPKGRHIGKYDLSKKIICGECGSTYYRSYRKRYKDGKYIIEWKCSSYLYHAKENGCKNILLNEEQLFVVLKKICQEYYHGYQIDSTGIIEKTIELLEKVMEQSDNSVKKEKVKEKIKVQQQLQDKLLDKLLHDIITDEVYKSKKTEIDSKINSLEEKLLSYQTVEDMKKIIEKRIQLIRKKLETEIIEKATISEMVENIESIRVYPKYLEVRFYLDKLLGINRDIFKVIDAMAEEIGDAFVVRYTLPEDFVYQNRKKLERERIVKYMHENPYITAREIAAKENISLSGVNYRIKKLKREKRIYFDGRGGHGKWVVVKKE